MWVVHGQSSSQNLCEEERIERYWNEQQDLQHLYAHDGSRWKGKYHQQTESKRLIVEPATDRRGRSQLDPLGGLGHEHHQCLGSGHGWQQLHPL